MEKLLLTISEASKWASEYLGKKVEPTNISYLIQYGRIKKLNDNGVTLILKNDLLDYYKSNSLSREESWKKQLGEDLNWALSFDKLRETDTTKHVHRLHPYKGKFIPQLVEYFLDEHTDFFKKAVYFHTDDIVLDPFCGSGTTLVQANELGLNAIGIDVSAFNSFISNTKIYQYDFFDLNYHINEITYALMDFLKNNQTIEFEKKLLDELYIFNNNYFPVPDFKFNYKGKKTEADKYGEAKAAEFFPIFQKLATDYNIELLEKEPKNFLEKWFTKNIQNEIEFVFNRIKAIENRKTKAILSLILSRTMRSCRATTHADLATLQEPVTTTYYCAKHSKICKPLFSLLKWWQTYCKDTIKRLHQFDNIRTNSFQRCLTGDSRTINIFEEVLLKYPKFASKLKSKKIQGIFTSPPYVGLINYHEQHSYSYDLFGFARKDHLEIGPLFKGQGKEARESYVEGISDVLNNCKKYLVNNFDIFLVSNDKYNLYPSIAQKANLKIVNQYKRPVLNRTEKDKGAYSEIIFHLKNK